MIDRTLDQGDETAFHAATDLLKERRDDLDSLELGGRKEVEDDPRS